MRRTLIAFVVAILVLTPTSAHADSPVTVDCGDGSPLSTVASVDTLAGLQASIQGMIDNPTGMSCALGAATLSLGTTSSNGAFVVGGGRYDRGPGPGATQGCGENFSLNAHSDASGFHGEQTYTINNADGCGDLGFKGHIKANVTCLAVFGNRAQIKGTVSEVSGTFFTSIIAVGDVLESDVEDNGPRSSGVPDMIEPVNQPKDTGFVCAADMTPSFPVENGRITVHQ